tara:strand:+ start:1163 stop:2200 length:1038 start_codon:yes stop_codon:yes gene_type:complete
MIWPDAIPFYVIKGFIYYLSHPEGIQAGQSAWVGDWGAVSLIAILGFVILYMAHQLTTEPVFRPKLVLKHTFQEKVEGRIVWVKGEASGVLYKYWKFWAAWYRKMPFWMGMDLQFGTMLLMFGTIRIAQSVHFSLMGDNIIPQWGPEVGIVGRICFYGSLPLLLGYYLTARSDFFKLKKPGNPYDMAIGANIKHPQAVIYFRQTGRYLQQLLRPAQLWFNTDDDPISTFFGRRVIESANLSLVPNVKGDIYVLHDRNDAPSTMEDWMGIAHLVSDDIKGSQKLIVSASAADPDVLKRQQERTTYTLNLDWEKMMLEMAEADGTITPKEQELLEKYFKSATPKGGI